MRKRIITAMARGGSGNVPGTAHGTDRGTGTNSAPGVSQRVAAFRAPSPTARPARSRRPATPCRRPGSAQPHERRPGRPPGGRRTNADGRTPSVVRRARPGMLRSRRTYRTYRTYRTRGADLQDPRRGTAGRGARGPHVRAGARPLRWRRPRTAGAVRPLGGSRAAGGRGDADGRERPAFVPHTRSQGGVAACAVNVASRASRFARTARAVIVDGAAGVVVIEEERPSVSSRPRSSGSGSR